MLSLEFKDKLIRSFSLFIFIRRKKEYLIRNKQNTLTHDA